MSFRWHGRKCRLFRRWFPGSTPVAKKLRFVACQVLQAGLSGQAFQSYQWCLDRGLQLLFQLTFYPQMGLESRKKSGSIIGTGSCHEELGNLGWCVSFSCQKSGYILLASTSFISRDTGFLCVISHVWWRADPNKTGICWELNSSNRNASRIIPVFSNRVKPNKLVHRNLSWRLNYDCLRVKRDNHCFSINLHMPQTPVSWMRYGLQKSAIFTVFWETHRYQVSPQDG